MRERQNSRNYPCPIGSGRNDSWQEIYEGMDIRNRYRLRKKGYTMLPQEFTNRMRDMLKAEYPAFEESYQKEKYQALRVNPLKADRKDFMEKSPFGLKEVLWEPDGFYYGAEDKPGKHPYHEAGVYYIQEPSAMLPAMLLKAQPGERVLDLCAAPGGKSTKLGAAMRGRGILVCNEIHPARAKILSENIERMGIRNALVTNETPQRLQAHFTGYFDRILVDAPCSGEGMFRKNEEASEEWSVDNVHLCAGRQDEILDCAADMLRPGGRLVYSTCTFAPDENEGSICRFLKRHPEFAIQEVPFYEGMEQGVPGWCGYRTDEGIADESMKAEEIRKTIRLWPHKLQGEGHYAAVLAKAGDKGQLSEAHSRFGEEKGITERECREYLRFAGEYLTKELSGTFLLFGEQLYLMPKGMPSLRGLKVLRPGLHLGTMKKNRFEPSHALALALNPAEVKLSLNLAGDGREIRDYLNGQTFPAEGEKGWYLITVDGYSTGWGKLAGGIMKNHYPKGLRKNLQVDGY